MLWSIFGYGQGLQGRTALGAIGTKGTGHCNILGALRFKTLDPKVGLELTFSKNLFDICPDPEEI